MMLGSGGLIELRRLESVKGFVPLMRVWTLAVPSIPQKPIHRRSLASIHTKKMSHN